MNSLTLMSMSSTFATTSLNSPLSKLKHSGYNNYIFRSVQDNQFEYFLFLFIYVFIYLFFYLFLFISRTGERRSSLFAIKWTGRENTLVPNRKSHGCIDRVWTAGWLWRHSYRKGRGTFRVESNDDGNLRRLRWYKERQET